MSTNFIFFTQNISSLFYRLNLLLLLVYSHL
jgi:hypothetical protein